MCTGTNTRITTPTSTSGLALNVSRLADVQHQSASVMRVACLWLSSWWWGFGFSAWFRAPIHSITEIVGFLAQITRRTGIDANRPSAVIFRWASCKQSPVRLNCAAKAISLVVNLVFGIISFSDFAFIRWPLLHRYRDSRLYCDCFQLCQRAVQVGSMVSALEP